MPLNSGFRVEDDSTGVYGNDYMDYLDETDPSDDDEENRNWDGVEGYTIPESDRDSS